MNWLKNKQTKRNERDHKWNNCISYICIRSLEHDLNYWSTAFIEHWLLIPEPKVK
jgi:hypothetical protein